MEMIDEYGKLIYALVRKEDIDEYKNLPLKKISDKLYVFIEDKKGEKLCQQKVKNSK